MINIVLHEPEIPFNTGAIGRTCVATDSRLHMIGPYGFVLNDKYLKRAGMDYWEKLKLSEYIDYEDFLSANKNLRFAGEEHEDREASSGSTDKSVRESVRRPHLWFATTKARQTYSAVSFGPDDFIMFDYVRERISGNSGRNTGRASGRLRPDTDVGRNPLTELIKFGCDYSV